jgi:predicted TIM-barrel fold metal-dependent hydrolase
MEIENYQPVSALITKNTLIKRSRFPVIDAHNHLDDEFGGGWIHRPISVLLATLDDMNVRTLVDLDGGWGEKTLQIHIDKLKSKAPETFKVFGGVNWEAWENMGDRFPEWAASRIREQSRWGADGIKIWKNLGLRVRDPKGNLVQIQDRRLDVIWRTIDELNLPVVIHAGDPAAFFEPLDDRNERWEELNAHPDWHVPSPPFPHLSSILDGLMEVVGRYPAIHFIGAHVAGYTENLVWVRSMLDKHPNLYVDIAARISELGRQPYSTRKFFLDYSDRILFGIDCGPDKATYQNYFRFLETEDEYFNYSTAAVPDQGRWYIYGLGLPDSVLEKVYATNARKALRLFQA